MFMIDYKQIIWWYWFGIACTLTVGMAGFQIGFVLAIGLSLVQFMHFAISERSLTAFPVQVRFCVLIYMLLSFPEPMQIAYWIPVVGTWARSIFGYCVMARTLALMPWNRREPFSKGLLMRMYFSRPIRGNILQGLPPIQK
jgi:hypothetical protein